MWPELLHLSRSVPRRGPALPFIFIPTLRNTTFEILPYSRKYFLRLLEYKTDSILLAHGTNLPSLRSVSVVLQNASGTWLTKRNLPKAAYSQVSVDLTRKALLCPEFLP